MLRQASNAVLKVSAMSMNALSKLPTKSRSIITTTRVIPPRTREAHDEAMECANDVIEIAKHRQDRRATLLKVQHTEFARSSATRSDRYHRKTSNPKTFEPNSFNVFPSLWNVEADEGGDRLDEEVESLFSHLSHNINQQRKVLKRDQKELFDHMWG